MEDINQLVAGLESFVRHNGAVAVLLIIAIEAIGAPVPGETLLIFASLFGRPRRNVFTGSLALCVGRLGAWRQPWLPDRLEGRTRRDVEGRLKDWFDQRAARVDRNRYGSATVLSARFFSILRQLNGIVAGILGMPWWRFALFDACGAALWVMVWVFAPAYFAKHLDVIVALAHHTKVVASALVIGCLAVALTLFIRHRRTAGGTAWRRVGDRHE